MFPANQNSFERIAVTPVYNILVTEEGQDFLDYLTRLGLIGESDMLVLSLRNHYYFDHNDLKDVKVLVILKKLNTIKYLDSFLNVIFRILPSGAHFIGCFNNSRSPKDIGSPYFHSSAVFNKFINFLDLKANMHLDKNSVKSILESHGFKIVDVTEINGQIYFTSQNKRMPL